MQEALHASPVAGRLTPAAAARECLVEPQTVRDWITVGVKLPDGKRVRLRAERVGGRWWVLAADLAAFRDRCTAGALPPDDGAEVAGCPVMSKSDRREYEAAQKRLKARGL